MNSREPRDRHLLVVIADRSRPIENPGALALGGLEQVSRIHVLHVERRILAHYDRGEVPQRALLRFALRVPVPIVRAHLERDGARAHPSRVPTMSGCMIANTR